MTIGSVCDIWSYMLRPFDRIRILLFHSAHIEFTSSPRRILKRFPYLAWQVTWANDDVGFHAIAMILLWPPEVLINLHLQHPRSSNTVLGVYRTK